MSKAYLNDKAIKKSFALKGMLLLLVLAIIFTIFMVRYALSGSPTDYLNGAPTSDDAYNMAKYFIKPTIKSSHVSFPISGFQCAQKPDSVFIIKSYAETDTVTGQKNTITYEITLQYIGGNTTDKNNWKVVNMNEN